MVIERAHRDARGLQDVPLQVDGGQPLLPEGARTRLDQAGPGLLGAAVAGFGHRPARIAVLELEFNEGWIFGWNPGGRVGNSPACPSPASFDPADPHRALRSDVERSARAELRDALILVAAAAAAMVASIIGGLTGLVA